MYICYLKIELLHKLMTLSEEFIKVYTAYISNVYILMVVYYASSVFSFEKEKKTK